MKQGQILRAPK